MADHTTTKYALRYPDLASSADIALIVEKLAEDTDSTMVGFIIDVFANRPAAGKAGRRFYATDTTTEYLDTGSAWAVIGSSNRMGILADIPAANSVSVGTKYFATDQIVEYISNGSAWIRMGAPCGAVNMQLGSAADSGYILLQGQSWPSTSGVYADLFAKLGGSVLPDFRQYVPVGYKSGDSDFGTLLGTGGEKTHVLSSGEMPAHTHAPGGGHGYFQIGDTDGTGPFADTGAGPGNLDGGGLANATASAGGGSAHNNLQPFKVVNFQAKL